MLLWVYLLHQPRDNEEEFLYQTRHLLSIIKILDAADVIISGDVNAHTGPTP